MDLWVIVGAAAAGYIGKYWQNLSEDRDSLPDLSSKGSNFEEPDLPSCPFRRLVRRKKLDKDVSTDRGKISDQRYGDLHDHCGGSAVEVASTSEFESEKLGSLGNYENCNLLSISSLPSRFLPSENLKGNECDSGLGCDTGEDQNSSETGSFYSSARTKSSFRTKTLHPHHLIRPLDSLESCLMAQLYKKQSNMEKYVHSSLPSPSTPTIRQLFVTDGSRIISRSSSEVHSARIRADDHMLYIKPCLVKNENMLGVVPQLPQIGSLDFPKQMKCKSGKGRLGRLSNSSRCSDGSLFHSQSGSEDAKVLFSLGISIGLISSFVANRKEVDKLKALLKQTENLVQDLQEELEMKDSLTVKELANEENESLAICDNSFSIGMLKLSYPEKNMDNLEKYDAKESYDKKAEEIMDSMSKIEAELEAELERIGLKVNSSSLEGKLADLVELDPDFEADFAKGDLRASMVNRDKPDLNQDASGTSTHHSGNYAVSPRELSLRLHEVIQSRLEERVKELETSLEHSQRKVQLMESQHKNSRRKFANITLRYSSDEESKEESNSMTEPLVMNLSGEALDAYNEAYEELMKIDDSEDEDSPSGDYGNIDHIGSPPLDQSVSWVQKGATNGSSPHTAQNKERISSEWHPSQRTSKEHSLRVELLDTGVCGEDATSDSEDEMEKQLIRRIVEKTKKGSPAVLNAQKWLFLMNEDKHSENTKDLF